MSKTLVFLFISSLLLFSAAPLPKNNYAFGKAVATCYGNSPCKACSNCSACKYCNSGGSCGICAKPKTTTSNSLTSNTTTTKTNVYVGQCKALTKKERGVKEVLAVMVIVGNMGSRLELGTSDILAPAEGITNPNNR